MGESGPEESLDEVGVPVLVGVGEGVAGRRGHSEAGEGGTLETQPVAHVVESDGVGELGEEHRGEMAADAEVAGLGFGSRLPRVLTDEPARNEVEQLLEDGNIGSGWRFFVHTPLPSGRGSKGASPLFSLDRASLCGMAVIFYRIAQQNLPRLWAKVHPQTGGSFFVPR